MAHDDLLNQPPEEVEMSLDEGPWRPFSLSGRSCEIGFKFLTLLLEVVEHFDLPHHGLVAMMFTIFVDLSCLSAQYGFRSSK